MNDASFTLVGGQVIVGLHGSEECSGKLCPIHNPSNHHMSEWEQNWHPSKYIIERICPHGVGHPDPDGPVINRKHDCDGCCVKIR